MEFTQVTTGIAFLAGLVSFLSPCVFALVPAYVGYLSGRSLSAASGGEVKVNKWETFSHGLAFVLGFSVVFVLLGVITGALRGLLFNVSDWLTKIGGVIIVIFGLHMMGVIHLSFLEYDLRPQNTPDRSRGYLSSALMGVFFSAGWSPCVGPILGTILTFILNGGSASQGAVWLTAYSAGLGIPFLVASLGVDWVTNALRKHGQWLAITYKVMGAFLVLVGVMLFLGRFQIFAKYAPWLNLGL
jgi:cytochrome c-type biogenesis protein